MYDLAGVGLRAVFVEERSDARACGGDVDGFEVAISVPNRVSVSVFREMGGSKEGVCTRSARQ